MTPPEILSTHPSSKRRQEQLTELMPKALDLAADSGCGQVHQYLDAFRQKVQDTLPLNF